MVQTPCLHAQAVGTITGTAKSPDGAAPPKPAPSNQPPPGFHALFNGTDLTGWWGASTEDPRKYMAEPPAEFQKKHDASLGDIRQHWSAQNGELVNDGHGLYLTTDKFYGDFELLVDYKTVPLADSGIYLRGCPQVQIWDYTERGEIQTRRGQGLGRIVEQPPGISRQRSAGEGRQTVWAMEPLSRHHGRRQGLGVAERPTNRERRDDG